MSKLAPEAIPDMIALDHWEMLRFLVNKALDTYSPIEPEQLSGTGDCLCHLRRLAKSDSWANVKLPWTAWLSNRQGRDRGQEGLAPSRIVAGTNGAPKHLSIPRSSSRAPVRSSRRLPDYRWLGVVAMIASGHGALSSN